MGLYKVMPSGSSRLGVLPELLLGQNKGARIFAAAVLIGWTLYFATSVAPGNKMVMHIDAAAHLRAVDEQATDARKQPFESIPPRTWDSLQAEYPHWRLHNISTQTDPPFKMACFQSEHVCEVIEKQGFWFGYDSAVDLGGRIKALPTGSDVLVVDVGSNMGFWGLVAASRGNTVVAVEPAFSHIVRYNAAINEFDRFMTLGYALTDTSGAGDMTMTLPEGNLGSATVVKRESLDFSGVYSAKTVSLTVPTATLDDLLLPYLLQGDGSWRAIDLFKIDAEGWERNIMLGAKELLAKRLIKQACTEFHRPFLQAAGVQPEQYMEIWVNAGFDVYPTGHTKPLANPIGWAQESLNDGLAQTDVCFTLSTRPGVRKPAYKG